MLASGWPPVQRGGFAAVRCGYAVPMAWVVYVLVSESQGETYVGITTDLERRLEQHNGEQPGGAKRTTRGRPWEVGARFGPFETRSEAQRVEYAVKKRRGRERLVQLPT